MAAAHSSPTCRPSAAWPRRSSRRPTPTSRSKCGCPASGWNGKFQATGNGGWNGNVDVNALAAGVRRGYATASTDTGHQGGGGPWMQNREKLIDYGYRAVHEMTVKGKAITAAFYGNQARLSYFTGCSAGGRQGAHRRTALPRGLRRHRRRRAGAERDRPCGVRDVRRAESPQGRSRVHPGDEVSGDSRRRAAGVRRDRRREGRRHRESDQVHVRPEGAGLLGR